MNPETRKPLNIGIAGLGGYAGSVRSMLLNNASLSDIRLTAVCDPDIRQHEDAVAELRSQGVLVVSNWDKLLAQPLDAVWLPLPIPLHRPFTEDALNAGIAVMCEKPAAGSVQDLDLMIVARDSSALPVAIGFQDIYKPSTAILKQSIVSGKIGTIQSAVLTGCWPRDSRYYARSKWAGRQLLDGEWVMDSPASNALAHFLNLALYLIGEDGCSAELGSVEAELYRANPIENYDTCALRYRTQSHIPLLVYLTHASAQTKKPTITITGDEGKVTYIAGDNASIKTKKTFEMLNLTCETGSEMVDRFANLLRDSPDSRHVATLEIARAHLIAVNGASEATAIRDLPWETVDRTGPRDTDLLLSIIGIEDLFEKCAAELVLPHESGLAEWTAPSGHFKLNGYGHFKGPKRTPNNLRYNVPLA